MLRANMYRMKNFQKAFLLGWGVLLLAGCASISIQPHTSVVIDQAPKKIYVEPFDYTKAQFNVDREGNELADFKTDLQQMMEVGMISDLTKRLLPATGIAVKTWPKAQHAWLIKGKFVLVNQGSRLLRGVIGFGAGGTKLETKVSVYDLSDPGSKPFLTFSTTGGSNAEPGAVAGLATDPLLLVIGTATGSAGGIAHGLTEDTARTAREITAQLSDYMYKRGWIPEDKWIEPKYLSK